MNPAAAAAQAELASRVLAKRRLLHFIQRMNPRYKAGWVHEDICRRLEKFSDDVAAEKSPRLMILMPPRHGKSEIASRMFPPWHLGRNPDHEIISCSYNIGLTMTFSRKAKEAINDPAYQGVFPGTQLKGDQQSTEEWGIQDRRGGYVAAGVGGGITGKGAHVLIIDDPIKNAEEADSADTREKLWDWYGSTAYTRLAPGGGVLVIQCMTGDTMVLMADGSEQRLDQVRAGDAVATFARGRLVTSRVVAQRSSGYDQVLKITTSSGKIARSNGRHPFLVETEEGLKWVRARNLTTDHKIVAAQGSGASGGAFSAQPKAVSCQPSAEGSAQATTASKNGLMGIARRLLIRSRAVLRTLNTGTASRPRSTTTCTPSKAVSAPCAGWLTVNGHPLTGVTAYASTTATPRVAYGLSYATAAIPLRDTCVPSTLHSPWRLTSDFTAEQVVSVEPDGYEEVFDLQIDRTENFIANGLVSHNTWWHDDDLAGRLQLAMKNSDDPFTDQFVVIKYPALAEADEYLDNDTDLIAYDREPANGRLLRRKGEALHPERYTEDMLRKIKNTIPTRWWSSLYQQNPVPDDGGYFTKDQFRRSMAPSLRKSHVFVAFDFAISEKKINDYTVGFVGLQDENDTIHVVDRERFKSGDSLFIVDAMLNLCNRWHNPSIVLGVEDGQIWRSMEAVFKRRMIERVKEGTLKGYIAIQALKPLTDKLTRARTLQARMQQGLISFVDKAEWYDSARLEMLRFPAGVHDDQVDSLAWMAQLAVGRAPPREKSARIASWKDRLASGFTSANSGYLTA